jgi:hypothetical protein
MRIPLTAGEGRATISKCRELRVDPGAEYKV